MTIPTDPLYSQQTHFDRIGDIESVWDDYTGRGVRVAVYDFGIDLAHPDLAANYDATGHFRWNGVTQDGRPDDPDDAHGTAVAGIIAAAANGVGTVGVAHGASVTAVELDPLFDNWEVFRAGFRHAANFDVMNNSWGLTAPFWDPDLNLNVAGSTAQVLDSLFAEIAATGRGGLGTVIVQAAGNDGYNANADGMLASRYAILVGARDPETGEQTDYSNTGTGLLISAPAAEVTTDNAGEAGFNALGSADGDLLYPDYTSDFGGTSGAAAVVSGAVALMLEANPNLGWRDVKQILALSAQTTGSLDSPSRPNTSTILNGTPLLYTTVDGFGKLNVHNAVRMAEAWSFMKPEAQTSANEVHHSVQFKLGNGVVRDAELGFSGSISPGYTQFNSASGTIPMVVETAILTVRLKHTWANDLKIYVGSSIGNGIHYVLDRQGGEDLLDDGLTWSFKIESLRGLENPADLFLSIQDFVPDDVGVVEFARLDLYGSEPTADDIHSFTDSYRPSSGHEALLVSRDGGNDWVNLAAVTGNMYLSLNASSLVVDHVNWLNIDSDLSSIHNYFLGDGNDTANCDDASNEIHGGRGIDSISGYGGTDRLYGGDGHDFIMGDRPTDIPFRDRVDEWSPPFAADLLWGDDGNDTLDGDLGNDTIYGGTGDDSLTGFNDNDLLQGNEGQDFLDGEKGDDTIFSGSGRDTARGGEGNDRISSGDDSDLTYGGTGDDTAAGDAGNDTIYGEDGNDSLTGGLGNDLIDAGSNDDRIKSGDGNDIAFGGIGNDMVDGGLGNDILRGNEGSDTLYAQDGNDTVFGGAEDDWLWLTLGDDSGRGDGGNDAIRGGDGRDTVDGGTENDSVDGGTGDDSVLGGDGDDSVTGGTGNDTVDGGRGLDTLGGGDGDDSLLGGSGRDRLDGEAGNDTLSGGEAGDTFLFRLGGGSDIVVDFEDNTDRLRLDHRLWAGDLSGKQVVNSFGSIDAEGRLVLDFGDAVLILQGLGSLKALYNDLNIL